MANKLISKQEFKIYGSILLEFSLNSALTVGLFGILFLASKTILWILKWGDGNETYLLVFSNISTIISMSLSIIILIILSIRSVKRYVKLLK